MFKKILFILFLVFSGNIFASNNVFLLNTLAPSSELVKDDSSESSLTLFEQRLRGEDMDAIENNVLASYESLDDIEEFDYLDSLRKSLKNHRPEILELLAQIRKQFISKNKINPWLNFKIYNTDDKHYNSYNRHTTLELNKNLPANKVLKVGIISGTFDPFHIGHLLMGLNHLANGTSDFVVYLPNADAWINRDPAKPNKSNYNWRFKTVMDGGVEDMFPLLRVSSFRRHGEDLILNNQELIDQLDKIEFNVIIGSDILKKPNMVNKLKSDYKTLQQMGNHPGKINFTFHIIQRKNSILNETEIAEIRKELSFPIIIESSVSDASTTASSSQLKEGLIDNFSNLYPSSLNLLGAYIRYNVFTPNRTGNSA